MVKFRLATLLKIRERDRDQAAKMVQDARLAIAKVEENKRELMVQNAEMNDLRKGASSGAIDLRRLLDAQRFQMVLAAQVQQLDEHLGKLQQELERREASLLKCQQAVKSLEKLRDQRIESAETFALLKQQERTDEWSSVRHAMQIQTNTNEDEA
jgi:flagellar export protein FliJ